MMMLATVAAIVVPYLYSELRAQDMKPASTHRSRSGCGSLQRVLLFAVLRLFASTSCCRCS